MQSVMLSLSFQQTGRVLMFGDIFISAEARGSEGVRENGSWFTSFGCLSNFFFFLFFV